MSHNHMNNGGGRWRRRRRSSYNTCKANNIQVQDLGIEAIIHCGCPASAPETSGGPPAGSLNGTKPLCMVNGDVNHVYEDESGEELLQKTLKEKETIIPDVSDAPAAGNHSQAGFSIPGGATANGSVWTSLDAQSWNHQMVPKKKSFWRKKERVHKSRAKATPPPVQIEEEDWDKETQDKMQRDETPYGPEDMIHFPLWGMISEQRERFALETMVHNSPRRCHRRPVPWKFSHCFSCPIEPDQFEDADEEAG